MNHFNRKYSDLFLANACRSLGLNLTAKDTKDTPDGIESDTAISVGKDYPGSGWLSHWFVMPDKRKVKGTGHSLVNGQPMIDTEFDVWVIYTIKHDHGNREHPPESWVEPVADTEHLWQAYWKIIQKEVAQIVEAAHESAMESQQAEEQQLAEAMELVRNAKYDQAALTATMDGVDLGVIVNGIHAGKHAGKTVEQMATELGVTVATIRIVAGMMKVVL